MSIACGSWRRVGKAEMIMEMEEEVVEEKEEEDKKEKEKI